MKNQLKETLAQGRAAFGAWMMTNAFDNAQILSQVGADCIMIDGEHGSMDLETAGRLVTAIRTGPSAPLLRVPWNDIAMVKRALDTGCDGVMIPMINSREEAERAVSYCKYPPEGVRGMGAGRAALFGGMGGAYYPAANRETLVIVQIEHYLAVDAVEEILSVPGVDIAFIGPADLSVSMGLPMGSPALAESFQRVLRACERHHVVPGVMTSAGSVKTHLDMGFRFLLGGIDGLILYSGAKAITEEFRQLT